MQRTGEAQMIGLVCIPKIKEKHYGNGVIQIEKNAIHSKALTCLTRTFHQGKVPNAKC